MRLTYTTCAGVFAVLAGASLAAYAPRAGAQDNAARSDEPARAEDTPQVRFDPQITLRLQQLQAERRQSREQVIRDPKAWAEGRGRRALRHRAQLGEVWGNLVDSPDAQAGLRVHADRMARLDRMLDLAQAAADAALTARIQTDIQSELAHHARNMQTLRAALGVQ